MSLEKSCSIMEQLYEVIDGLQYDGPFPDSVISRCNKVEEYIDYLIMDEKLESSLPKSLDTDENTNGVSDSDRAAIKSFAQSSGFSENSLRCYFVYSKIVEKSGKKYSPVIGSPEEVAVMFFFSERTRRYDCVIHLLEIFSSSLKNETTKRQTILGIKHILEIVLHGKYVNTVLSTVQHLAQCYLRQSTNSRNLIHEEMQRIADSLLSLFSLFQMVRDDIIAIQKTVMLLKSIGDPSLASVTIAIYCSVPAALMSTPSFTQEIAVAQSSCPLYRERQLQDLLKDSEGNKLFAFAFVFALHGMAEIGGNSDIYVTSIDNVLSNNLSLPPSLSPRYRDLLYAIMTAFVQRYVLSGYRIYTHGDLQERMNQTGCRLPLLPDGIETTCDMLQALLPAGDADVTLTEFCNFLLSATTRQPLLFDTVLCFIAAVSHKSTEAAATIFTLLRDSDSAVANWSALLSALTQASVAVRGFKTGQRLLEEDCSGITGILLLLAGLMSNVTLRQMLLTDERNDIFGICLQLLPVHLPLVLSAAVCDVLSKCVLKPECAQSLWRQLETGRGLWSDSNTANAMGGALCALETEESVCGEYSVTVAVLCLLRTLLQTLPFSRVVESDVLFPVLRYVVHDILLKSSERRYATGHGDDRWHATTICLDIICYVVTGAADTVTDLRQSCVPALIAELLSDSQLTHMILEIQAIPAVTPSLAVCDMSSRFDDSDCVEKTVVAASHLLLAVMFITPAIITHLGISPTTPGVRGLVRPLASQLIGSPTVTARLLLRIADNSHPLLQLNTLNILTSVAAQTSAAAMSAFCSYCPTELRAIRSACCLLFRRGMLGEGSEAIASAILHLLMEQSTQPFESLTSVILDIPAIYDNLKETSIVVTLLRFLAEPSLIRRHLRLGVQALKLLNALCRHAGETTPRLYTVLLESGTLRRLISLTPVIVTWYDPQEDHQTEAVKIIGYITRIMSVIMFTLSQDVANIDIVRTVIHDIMEYDPKVMKLINGDMTGGSPVLDLLYRLRGCCRDVTTSSDIVRRCVNKFCEIKTINGIPVSYINIMEMKLHLDEWCYANNTANIDEFIVKGVSECEEYNRNQTRLVAELFAVSSTLGLVHVGVVHCHHITSPPPILLSSLTAVLISLDVTQCQVACDICNLIMCVTDVVGKTEVGNVIGDVIVFVLRDALQGDDICVKTRCASYLLILKLIKYDIHFLYQDSHARCDDRTILNVLQPYQTSLPALVYILTRDVIISDSSCRIAASALISQLLASDTSGQMTSLFLQEANVNQMLLSLFETIDMSLLTAPSAAMVLPTHLLSMLITVASSTTGTLALVTDSLFGFVNHCPLIASLRVDTVTLLPLSFPIEQKARLRRLLRLLLLLILRVESVSRPVRSMHVELAAFLTSLMPLTTLIFKVREDDDSLALEVLGLYLALLGVLANNRGKFIELMNGLERVLQTEVIGLLNYVSKQEKICSYINSRVREKKMTKTEGNDDHKNMLYLIIVENGMVFMSKMGWKIGDEYIRAFGVKP